MLNHIIIMGRLTRDPELRRTGSGIAVTSFTVAVERDFSNGDKKETDFIDCVAWRQTGEFVSKYFAKGSMIVVAGRLQLRDWNDKDGHKHRNAEIVVGNVYFGESRRSSGNNQQGAVPGGNNYNAPGYGVPSYSPTASYNGPAYGAPQVPGSNTYAAPPAGGMASDFAMLEDDDSQLPF